MWFNQQLSIFCVSAVVVLAATPAWADVTTVTGVRQEPEPTLPYATFPNQFR